MFAEFLQQEKKSGDVYEKIFGKIKFGKLLRRNDQKSKNFSNSNMTIPKNTG